LFSVACCELQSALDLLPDIVLERDGVSLSPESCILAGMCVVDEVENICWAVGMVEGGEDLLLDRAFMNGKEENVGSFLAGRDRRGNVLCSAESNKVPVSYLIVDGMVIVCPESVPGFTDNDG